MESLQQVFYQSGMSQRMAAIIVTAIIVPLSQVCLPRNFNQLIHAQCYSRACEKGSKQARQVSFCIAELSQPCLFALRTDDVHHFNCRTTPHASALLPSQLLKQYRWITHERE